MKHFLCFLLLFSLSFSTLAFAHGGRTDSEGGHRDYNNVSGLGPYHYHHDEPAHLHPNGICPMIILHRLLRIQTAFQIPSMIILKMTPRRRKLLRHHRRIDPGAAGKHQRKSVFCRFNRFVCCGCPFPFCYFVKASQIVSCIPLWRAHQMNPLHKTPISCRTCKIIFLFQPPAAAPLIPPQYVIGEKIICLPIENAPQTLGAAPFTVYLNYKNARLSSWAVSVCKSIHHLPHSYPAGKQIWPPLQNLSSGTPRYDMVLALYRTKPKPSSGKEGYPIKKNSKFL